MPAKAPVCSPSAAMISPGSETARRTTSRMASLPRSMRAARQTAAKRSMSNTDILLTFQGVTKAATTAIGRIRLTEGGNTVKACDSIFGDNSLFRFFEAARLDSAPPASEDYHRDIRF